MDAADIAQEVIERREADALAAHRANQAPVSESRTHCIFCDEPIPQRRREILPGVRCCVECAD
jgi:phage/conjugal plasmid C-4 type zinc finger TraR family protein